jgi:hypothetical protein
MDLRARLIAPSFHLQDDGSIGDFNFDALIKRLLLFETYILDSRGLTEIPHLVQAFGKDGLFLLLETGVLRINCSFSHTGSLTSSGESSPFHYKFVTIEPAEINEYVNLLLQEIEPQIEHTARQTVHLRRAIYASLEQPIDKTSSLALTAMREELSSSTQLLKSALIIALYKQLGIRGTTTAIEVAVEFDSENDFRVESNLQESFDLDRRTAHKIIEASCLAIARRNDRIEQMKRFSALTGFSDIDLPIFGEKLGFLASALSPDIDENRFQRIVELARLPQIKDVRNTRIDAKQLLKIRDSVECTEFRRWLTTTDAMSDDEIIQQIRSFSKIVGRTISGEVGQNIRFLITNGIGFVPVVGPVMSIPLSILDHFLIEKIFPRSGVSAFIDDMYPSLFEN